MASPLPPLPPPEVPATDLLPSEEALSQAAALLVVGADGKSRTFASLCDDVGKTTLIIFIRHFYCGDCQDYINALSSSIQPSAVATAQKHVRIIGCGDHTLIANYAAATSCPFEIYSSSGGALYDVLGMGRSLARGPEPEYVQRGLVTAVITSIGQGLRWGAPLKGGDIQRIGGEWLWEKGRPLWCHRMKNTRDHLEVPEIRALLQLPQGSRQIKWGL